MDLKCVGTTYIPKGGSGRDKNVLERFEDTDGEDVYEVPDNRVEEFLATGNFEVVT